MTAFPGGLSDVAPTRTSKVLGDNGSTPGNFVVAQLFTLIAASDILPQLLTTLDQIEPVPANSTSYTVVAADQNKTKNVLATGACAINLPAGMAPGFLVDFIQGPGVLTFQSAPGASQTIVAPRGARSGGPAGVRVTVEVVTPNVWNVSGDTQV